MFVLGCSCRIFQCFSFLFQSTLLPCLVLYFLSYCFIFLYWCSLFVDWENIYFLLYFSPNLKSLLVQWIRWQTPRGNSTMEHKTHKSVKLWAKFWLCTEFRWALEAHLYAARGSRNPVCNCATIQIPFCKSNSMTYVWSCITFAELDPVCCKPRLAAAFVLYCQLSWFHPVERRRVSSVQVKS